MLNKPYELLHEKGDSKYYFLNTYDNFYIATESIFNDGEVEFTQGLKVLELSFPLYYLLEVFSSSPIIEDKSDELEYAYNMIDPVAFRSSLDSVFDTYLDKTGTDEIPYFVTDSYPENDAITAFVKEGNPIMWVHTNNKKVDDVYCLGLNNLGIMHLFKFTTFKVNDTKRDIVDFSHIILGMDTINALVDRMKKEAQIEIDNYNATLN